MGARVVTAATILKACAAPQDRRANLVRFVQLREPIAEILDHDGTTAGAVRAADTFRNEILNLDKDTATSRFRARLVGQDRLLQDGIKLSRLMDKTEASNEGEETEERNNQNSSDDAYYGGKWGIYLRAPDLWFDLMDRLGGRFAALGELSEVRFGVKSGKDEFFFPRDVSQECLQKFPTFHEFMQEFGIRRQDVESGHVKLVRCGEKAGEIRPIEPQYLEPEVHNLMEVKGFTVKPEDCARMILLVKGPKHKLKGSYVLKYIEWGELKGYHKGSTCAARVTHSREWFDLTGHRIGNLFWPMAQQYKHAIPVNDHKLIANHNLFDVITSALSPELMAGVLNSSFVVLAKFLYGRPVGNEGNLKTEVIDVTMMPVPDPRAATPQQRRRVSMAFEVLKERPALQFLSERRMRRMAYTKTGRERELDEISDLSELDMDDRHDLDDAVLEMLGVTSAQDRKKLLDRLYTYLREFFEGARQKEELAIANKNRSKRKAALSPPEIAHQILTEIKDSQGHLLRPFRDFLRIDRPYVTLDLPVVGIPEVHEDIFAPDGSVRFLRGRKQISLVSTKNREQAALVASIALEGIRGLTRVPLAADECVELRQRYEKFVTERDRRLRAMVADRTGDPDLQERVFEALTDLIRHEQA